MEQIQTFSLSKSLAVREVLEFVRQLEGFESVVFFEKNGAVANGKSLLGMMSLFTTIRIGDKVHTRIKGTDADEVFKLVEDWLCDNRSMEDVEMLGIWEEEGVETVEKAMTRSLSSWSPDAYYATKSCLKIMR